MARHWIFDLDGTLIDSFPLYQSVFSEVAGHFQVPMSPAAWKDLPHIVLPKFLEKYFPAEHVEPAFNMVIEQNIARQSEIGVYPGIVEILRHLRDAECVLSICTAREFKTAVGVLEATGLKDYFGQIVTRDCVAQTKPHPEGIERLMTSTKTAVHETLMIGDHKMDIEAAKAAGIRAVAVSWNDLAHEEAGQNADHHFSSVGEFHRWVSGFNLGMGTGNSCES